MLKNNGQIIITAFLLIAVIALFQLTELDIFVQNFFYNFETQNWIIDKNEPILKFFFYDGIKILFIALVAPNIWDNNQNGKIIGPKANGTARKVNLAIPLLYSLFFLYNMASWYNAFKIPNLTLLLLSIYSINLPSSPNSLTDIFFKTSLLLEKNLNSLN